MQIFRFVNPGTNAAGLNLNDNNAWHLARGLVLGTKHYEKVTISQPPFDGAVVASAYAPPVEMEVPLLYGNPGTAKTPAQIRSDFDLLAAECAKLQNSIEMREPNDTASYYIDIYGPIDVPSMHQQQITPNPFLPGMKGFAGPIVLTIQRAPNLRGVGAMI